MKARLSVVLMSAVPLTLLAGAAWAASAKLSNDNPPTFNVEPSCRAAAAAANNQDRLQGCLDSEKKSREQLVNDWPKFTPQVRSVCLQAASVGGEPTYTELAACLDMSRDAKKTN